MIAPITGTMKRRVVVDITVGFAIGGVLGVWWWKEHKAMVATRENYYAQLAAKKKIENEL
ncbi:cytochrome c oxidase subunit VIIa [Martiniozyma asiatica (nom. inval.)]|nr:cytochrome c oxidase subunit VIIa [Martiniozyma asiatica]